MTTDQKIKRIETLTNALQRGRFKLEQRWLVHQEKAYLINSLSELPTTEPYKIPENLEKLL